MDSSKRRMSGRIRIKERLKLRIILWTTLLGIAYINGRLKPKITL
jgi:hypothetical protein